MRRVDDSTIRATANGYPEGDGRTAAMPASQVQPSAEPLAGQPLAFRLAVQPLLLKLEEAATLLAVSARTVKRMAADKSVPGVVHIGRALRFDRRKLEEWIGQGCPRRDGRRGR